MLVELTASLDDQLSGGGRSGGAYVGNEIGDGEVGFVADARNDGDGAGGDGPGHFFFVERPEIFERATATREDQHVDYLLTVEVFDGANDLGRRAFTLHAHRIEGEVHVVEAAAQDANDVAVGRATRRSDEADTAWEERERLFAFGGEEAFGFKALFELIKRQL